MKILFVLKSQGFFYYILFLLICTQLEYLYFAGLTGKCQEGYKRPRFPFNINTQPAPFILSEKDLFTIYLLMHLSYFRAAFLADR